MPFIEHVVMSVTSLSPGWHDGSAVHLSVCTHWMVDPHAVRE
jgi:hypothetical protein